MPFTENQITELQADLNGDYVSTRTQASVILSYMEGWRVIAEANRIFGHDGWTRRTEEMRCVSEYERKVGQGTGWGVTYLCRVTVSAYGSQHVVNREGCGSGHGIDRDLGLAHESAMKEAETDATKRAMMTFGWPFGLALYDKKKTHVVQGTKSAHQARKDGNWRDLMGKLESFEDSLSLGRWALVLKNSAKFKTMPESWQKLFFDEPYAARESMLRALEATAKLKAGLKKSVEIEKEKKK